MIRTAAVRRLWLVTQLDLRESLLSLFFLFWVLFMAWNSWLLSRGEWFARSNSTSLGGNLAYVNSEFQITYVAAMISFFVLSFFVAIAAGTTLLKDDEHKVGEVLHATPLSPGEYVWGKFLAAAGTSLAAVAVFAVLTAVFAHGMPDPERPEAYGPFALRIYVVPILVFLVPAVLFVAGLTFLLGRLSGRPILVFFVPVAFFVFYWFFYWRWNPPELSQTARFWLQMTDPSGFRWLRQNFLTVDRGIAYYNTRPVDYSAAFLLSRLGVALAGLGCVDLARRHFAGRLRRVRKASRRALARRSLVPPPESKAPSTAPLAALRMTSKPRSILSGALTVARFELAELFSHPALYILIPIILALVGLFFANLFGGEFRSAVYLTSGVAAVGSLAILGTSLLLLLLFYTVESLRRESATGAAAVVYSTPVRTPSLLLGKAIANGAVVAVVLLATLANAVWVMFQQGWAVGFDLKPFLLVWALLLPTVVLWIVFLMAAWAVTRSQYGTYAAGFTALGLTAWAGFENHLTWVGNWPLFNSLMWTDMGVFPMDRAALILNRLLALGLAAFLLFLAFRLFSRQDRDPLHPLFGRQPGRRRRTIRLAAALALVPLGLGFALSSQVNQGYQGGAVEKRREDYWRFNHATWLDAPVPYISNVDLDLDVDPATRSFRVSGYYDLRNDQTRTLAWFPVTVGMAWKDLRWTLDGKPYQPEDSHGLQVFRRPMAPGETLRLGFRYEGALLPGVSRNGGQIDLGEFITPAGGVVTGRNPDFVPIVKYDPSIGASPNVPREARERAYQPKTFPPGWNQGVTEAEIDPSSFTHRLRITIPAEYEVTSTGFRTSDEVKDGRRTAVWVSDYPVRVFNIAFGRWAERRGKNGTVINYHPGHTENLDSMLEALDGARRYYSEWFYPYPWKELRLNEFPALAQYGRGNATNIFFSEGIGFLTRRMPDNDAAFLVAAHEAAHSWWGHVVSNGEGPGGVVMSEGTAHFATLMLMGKLRGPRERMGMCSRMETEYAEFRQPSDEKPLAGTYRFRPGDTTVIYDKGGWVVWMLLNRMGWQPFMDGVHDYFRTYHNNPDHPVVEDFVAVMRRHAVDKADFDDFARQWFFGIVIPEYHLADAKKRQAAGGEWEATVTVRNAGTGRMPVEIAAIAGYRFEDGYRDARTTVVLGAGEERQVRIRCPFEPEAVVVDPDVKVMQLERNAAAVRL